MNYIQIYALKKLPGRNGGTLTNQFELQEFYTNIDFQNLSDEKVKKQVKKRLAESTVVNTDYSWNKKETIKVQQNNDTDNPVIEDVEIKLPEKAVKVGNNLQGLGRVEVKP